MRRITITIDDGLLAAVDRLTEIRGYQNRSQAIRDLVRAGMPPATLEAGSAPHCVGALVYVYEFDERERPRRTIHDRRDLSIATTRFPLDRHVCVEVSLLKGPTKDVRHFSEHVIAERGVSHGQLVTVPVEADGTARPIEGRRAHRHVHVT
jgi:CopG family nickel-responsive transcriptional regulator